LNVAAFCQFAPAAGEPGSTAIHMDSSAFIAWANEVVEFDRGLMDITNPEGPLASFGDESEALGMAEGSSTEVVSLGDKGSITVTFEHSIRNDEGFDFAVFENGFSDDYLEFAHVEVSTDGERFVRLPSVSNISTEEQTGGFSNSDPTEVYNLAGKYRQGYGTPFDLEDIADSTGIDLENIVYVRIIDVVGSIDPEYGTMDSEGNLINDPFKTDFESGGFDLDAVGVIHNNDPTIGIQDQESIAISLYPNPSQGIFNIETSAQIVGVKLIDLGGRIAYESQGKSVIDLSSTNLEKGTYFVYIQVVNGTFVQKLIYR
jgi:hypothetical protein